MLLIQDLIEGKEATLEERFALAEDVISQEIERMQTMYTKENVKAMFPSPKLDLVEGGDYMKKIFPKHKTFLECEKLIESYRRNNRITNYMNEYNMLDDMSKKLGDHFNAHLDLISMPIGVEYILNYKAIIKTKQLPPVSLMDYNAFTLFSVSSLIRNIFSPSTLFEVKGDRIAYKESLPAVSRYMTVACSSELIKDDKFAPGETMFIILHEIGHNFFLKSWISTLLLSLALPQIILLNFALLVSKISFILLGKLDTEFFNSIINPILLLVSDIKKIYAASVNKDNINKLGSLHTIDVLRKQLGKETLKTFDTVAASVLTAMSIIFKTLGTISAFTRFQNLIEVLCNSVGTIFEKLFASWATDYQIEERFADDFAIMHGYGSEAATIQAKMTNATRGAGSTTLPAAAYAGVPDVLKVIDSQLTVALQAMEHLDPAFIFDSHPLSMDRELLVIKNYDSAIAAAKSPSVKKGLMEQRKRIMDQLVKQKSIPASEKINRTQLEAMAESPITSIPSLIQDFFNLITPDSLLPRTKTISSMIASIGQ